MNGKSRIQQHPWLLSSIVLGAMACTSGCEQKEKVLDIKAPGVDIEVNKSTSDPNVEVDVKTDKN